MQKPETKQTYIIAHKKTVEELDRANKDQE